MEARNIIQLMVVQVILFEISNNDRRYCYDIHLRQHFLFCTTYTSDKKRQNFIRCYDILPQNNDHFNNIVMANFQQRFD